ncbi:Ankyrin repeat domain-containing protein 55 [Lobulomyces angularis]|nr:Ankyrin repeat domain-containing protein 55 [Lobulomyces angularis]
MHASDDEEIEKLVNLIKTRDVNVLARQCATNSKLTAGLLTFTDTQGNTAFSHAVASGHLETVKLLLKMGADANKPNDYGWTPLCVGCYHGHLNIIKFLLENTAQHKNSASVFGFTALMCSVNQGRLAITKQLIDNGVYLNSAGAGKTGQGTGLTPLMLACLKGYLKIAKLLLDRGAEHNTQCQLNGWTALMYAANGASKKQNIPIKNDLNSLVDPPEKSSSRMEIIELLISYGTDPTLKNWAGKTASEIAIETIEIEVGEYLKKLMTKKKSNGYISGDRCSKSNVLSHSESSVSLESKRSGHSQNNSEKNTVNFQLKKNKESENSEFQENEEYHNDGNSNDKNNWFSRFTRRKDKVTERDEKGVQLQPPTFQKKRGDNDEAKLSIDDDPSGERSSRQKTFYNVNGSSASSTRRDRGESARIINAEKDSLVRLNQDRDEAVLRSNDHNTSPRSIPDSRSTVKSSKNSENSGNDNHYKSQTQQERHRENSSSSSHSLQSKTHIPSYHNNSNQLSNGLSNTRVPSSNQLIQQENFNGKNNFYSKNNNRESSEYQILNTPPPSSGSLKNTSSNERQASKLHQISPLKAPSSSNFLSESLNYSTFDSRSNSKVSNRNSFHEYQYMQPINIPQAQQQQSLKFSKESSYILDLCSFLEKLELKNYLPLFENAFLNLEAVLGLNDEDLKELGIKLSSHRKQLLTACQQYKENVQKNNSQQFSRKADSGNLIPPATNKNNLDKWGWINSDQRGGSRSVASSESSHRSRKPSSDSTTSSSHYRSASSNTQQQKTTSDQGREEYLAKHARSSSNPVQFELQLQQQQRRSNQTNEQRGGNIK